MMSSENDSPPQSPKTDPLFDEPVWLFPFEGMQRGESFFIPTLKPSLMMATIAERAKAVKIRVKCFTTESDGCLGVRVWRIS